VLLSCIIRSFRCSNMGRLRRSLHVILVRAAFGVHQFIFSRASRIIASRNVHSMHCVPSCHSSSHHLTSLQSPLTWAHPHLIPLSLGYMPLSLGYIPILFPSHLGTCPSHLGTFPSHLGTCHSHLGTCPSHLGTFPSHLGTCPSHLGTFPSHLGNTSPAVYPSRSARPFAAPGALK